MNRRTFLSTVGAAALAMTLPEGVRADAAEPPLEHRLPKTDYDYRLSSSYIENMPISQYSWASEHAVEAFRDMKFGLRIHFGIYSHFGRPHESWPFLHMPLAERQSYQQVYQTWNPSEFDADAWMNLCHEAGCKMFAFTTKHHEGFSMFDTKTRVTQRTNWTAPGGPAIENCDLAYSIMETPFRRDIVHELTRAAHKRKIKIDLYYSHPDWYDTDFRPYGFHPLQVPSAPQMWEWQPAGEPAPPFWDRLKSWQDPIVKVAEPTSDQVTRMVKRHRAQLTELLTRYGTIDMMCLDGCWGPQVWPHMRETLLKIRELQPDVMLRDRGIGNYGDYYTPEGFVPGGVEPTKVPWFVIYPLGSTFSYDGVAANYKGTEWILRNLIDTTAKGGNFMAAIGPNGLGSFHPTAIEQLQGAGEWLNVNGEGIYATRPRPGLLWSEGADLRFTRTKDDRAIYCFTTKWPGSTLAIKSLRPEQVGKVEMLGYTPGKLATRWDPNQGLLITIPENLQQDSNRPCKYAWGFKISRPGVA